MIRKYQHHKKTFVKTGSLLSQTHTEIHLITVVKFLFIPVWKNSKLIQSNI